MVSTDDGDAAVDSLDRAVNGDSSGRRRADALALKELARRDGHLLVADDRRRRILVGNRRKVDVALRDDGPPDVDEAFGLDIHIAGRPVLAPDRYVAELHADTVKLLAAGRETAEIERHEAARDVVDDDFRASGRGEFPDLREVAALQVDRPSGKGRLLRRKGAADVGFNRAGRAAEHRRRHGQSACDGVLDLRLVGEGRRRDGKESADVHVGTVKERHAGRIEHPEGAVRNKIAGDLGLVPPGDHVEELRTVEIEGLPATDVERLPVDQRRTSARCDDVRSREVGIGRDRRAHRPVVGGSAESGVAKDLRRTAGHGRQRAGDKKRKRRDCGNGLARHPAAAKN